MPRPPTYQPTSIPAWVAAFRSNIGHLRTVVNGTHRCELCWMWRVSLDGDEIIPDPDNGYQPADKPYSHHVSCLAGQMGLF